MGPTHAVLARSSERPPTLRTLLRVDCTGALVVGCLVLTVSGWLATLYAVPRTWIVALGAINVAYGLFSLSLAVRRTPPRGLVGALAAANMGWGVACLALAAGLAGRASALGLAHLVVEGAFVGGLGALEWRRRPRE